MEIKIQDVGSRMISDFLIPWTCMRQVCINLHLLWVRAVHTRILGISNLRGMQPCCTSVYSRELHDFNVHFPLCTRPSPSLDWICRSSALGNDLRACTPYVVQQSKHLWKSLRLISLKLQLSAEIILIRLKIFPGDVVVLTIRVSPFAGPKK